MFNGFLPIFVPVFLKYFNEGNPHTMTLLLFFAGLLFLIGGAELLVRGASRLATVAGISKLVIGLTVVAYGTSFPELMISTVSSMQGKADIALGNVVGSNIFNILFILGLSAMILPLSISRQLVRLDVPVMMGVSILLLLMALNGTISRLEGTFLVILGALYSWWQIRIGRDDTEKNGQNRSVPEGRKGTVKTIVINILWVVIGLLLLVAGSGWLVDGVVFIARSLGVGELFIALVVVAAGTSLPEAATSIVAAIRKERDIAVGNIIGSNIFNILFVLGFSGLFASETLQVNPAALSFDIPFMTAATFACLPIFFTGFRITRWEGALFLLYYIAYIVYLVLTASRHDVLYLVDAILFLFILPITVTTLLLTTLHAVRKQRNTPGNGRRGGQEATVE